MKRYALLFVAWFLFVFGFGYFGLTVFDTIQGVYGGNRAIIIHFLREIMAALFFAGWWLIIIREAKQRKEPK